MKRTSPSSLPRSRHTVARTAGNIVAAIAISGSIALGPTLGTVAAQDAASTPAATPSAATPQASASAAQITALMTTTIDEMPAAPLTVRLLRITIQPGASVPMHTHPGPEFDRVESGSLTVSTKGTGSIFRTASGESEALTDDKATLNTGEWILYPAGAGMHFVNDSDQPVNLLSAVLLPVGADAPESITYTDGAPAQDAFTGVSFTVLGDGLISELPAGAATVSIDELTVPAGSDLPAATGPVMFSRVSGDLAFRVDGGDVQVSRTANPGLQPNAIPDQEFTLATGDAAFFPSGVDAMSRADAKGDLVVYRLAIEPKTAVTGSAAAVQAIAPDASVASTSGTPVASAAKTPSATEPAAGTWAAGTIVHTTEDGVNMRSEPSTDADIVNQLNADIELEVVEGPQDANGETWYQVRLTDGSEGDWSIGWVAKNFLVNQSETPTPAATKASGTPGASPVAGTPVASPAATTFKNDDIVKVTEDRVRVRTEASTDADAIDVVPEDQELRIIGGPEKADGITWYQVEYVGQEDMTGWVAGQFLKLAPAEDQGQ